MESISRDVPVATPGKPADRTQDAAYPVASSGMPGLFKPASDDGVPRDAAVLFLSPWGIDELSTRRFFRILSEDFARLGMASLRFDYPGTGNALDATDTRIDVDCWTSATRIAAEKVLAMSGASNVVLVGFGIGAAIACRAAKGMENVAGIALLAPMTAGKRYLRELSVWSNIIDEGVGVPVARRDVAPGTIAGLTMPEGVIATLDSLKPDIAANLPVRHVFFAARPDSVSDLKFRDRFLSDGVTLRDCTFPDYDRLVSNPLGQRLPTALMAELLDWAAALPASAMPARTPTQNAEPENTAVLDGKDFRETALRFGDGKRLIGTLCEPKAEDTGVSIVLLSTACDHQAGWGRSSVELARRLAARGVGSLRFDSADVGDSPPVPGRGPQVIYDDTQIADVALARSVLDDMGRTGPALLYGRCSGAYVAFRAAAGDQRWAGCIAVNPFIFRSLGPISPEFVRSAPRPLAAYSQRALKVDTFRRLLRGEIDIRSAVRHIGSRMTEKLYGLLTPVFGALMPTERLNRAVKADFQSLSSRPAGTRIVYSADDIGLDNFHAHFGKDGNGLQRYRNTELHILEETDHNITPRESREELLRIVEMTALKLADGNMPAPSGLSP